MAANSGAFPVAGEQPQLSGGMIPIIFATRLLVEFYKTTVFGAIANTDYEGEVKKMGDTLRINDLPDITIRDYVAGQNLIIEAPEPSFVDLPINKGKYWYLSINDVNKAQANIAYAAKWATHASIKLKNSVDVDILANTYADAHASNKGITAGLISASFNLGVSGTPLSYTKTNALDTIVDINTVLDEQNVPDEGRWVVLPAWATNMLLKSDLKNAALTGDSTSPVRNGVIGMVDNMTIYKSNNLAKNSSGGHTAYECMFGHSVGLAFAAQINKSETLRNQVDFGDLMRSLMVYGYKVIKPEAIGHLHIYKA